MSTITASATAAQLNLQLRVSKPSSPELVHDYQQAVPKLAPFFAGHPGDITSWRRVAASLKKFPETVRRAMADALQPTTELARAKLERIAAGEGFFVATGQQAGLFGGPLFTVHKTLTAIKLAHKLESELGITVAPLFWVAADDHDFAEVNHTFVFTPEGEARRIEIQASDEVPRSMNQRLLDDSIRTAISALESSLPPSEYASQVMAWVRAAYVPGRSMAEAFTQLMQQVFAGFDLLITSSANPFVKSLTAPVILRELERSREHGTAVRAQTDRLLSAGYHEQVTVRPDAANVLFEDKDGRDRLVREDGSWHLARTRRQLDSNDLLELLTTMPESFSPNVLLRPVVASAVFPTVAYVGGPAEVSYFAQIGCLFDAHEVAMPMVQPRASVEIIEHKVQKVLDKFGLEADAVKQPFDQLASQVVRDELPEGISSTVQQLRDDIARRYAELVDAARDIDPTLQGPLESARNASHKALADAEKKIVSHLKKKNEIGIEQLRKASTNLFPDGHPQERVINPLSYIARYGSAFLDAVAEKIEFDLSMSAPEWTGVKCDD